MLTSINRKHIGEQKYIQCRQQEQQQQQQQQNTLNKNTGTINKWAISFE